jgi:plasmid stabilization system protein ParE
MNFRILPEANAELREAVAFLLKKSPGAAQRLKDRIGNSLAEIQENPYLCAVIDKNDLRRKLVKKSEYSILYTVDLFEILVIAIMHQKREPGYWRDRL